MKAKNNYVLLKKSIYKKIVSYEYDEFFSMTKKKDKESIGTIKFYDDKIIEGVIKRSIDNRFKKLLELIASLEESDEDPSNGYLFCLDEAEKFKRELINKYDRFLKKTQIEFMNKKIELIEKDIKNKLIAYRLIHSPIFQAAEMEDEEEIVEERSRGK